MSIVNFIAQLQQLGIILSDNGNQLSFKAPRGALTPSLREAIAARKAEILNFLRETNPAWRTTEYIRARDGVRLAADIFRPTIQGNVVTEPLPVVWTHARYRRATVRAGVLVTLLEELPWLHPLINHGYVVGVVDVRGGGASEGVRHNEFAPQEALDAYDIIEWFAQQSWCNGNIGMFGHSYMGINQFLAASTKNPHLKAIFPEMALFDLYDFLYPGGIFRNNFVSNWGEMVHSLDTRATPEQAVALIEEPGQQDHQLQILEKTLQTHSKNVDVLAHASFYAYRDSQELQTGLKLYNLLSPSNYLSEIKQSSVAIYHMAGWYDLWCRDALVWFNNLSNPQKLVIGPWSHSQSEGFDSAKEHINWYDYWLKEVNNSTLEPAPIHYYTMGAPENQAWRTAQQWPLPNQVLTPYYLLAGPTKTVASVNDGFLDMQAPSDYTGEDNYTVDYNTTSGTSSRWANGYSTSFEYPDMTTNDSRCLTYTTLPLTADLEITGHPIIHLWISATSSDVNFFAYLEEIDIAGKSNYISEGLLKVSHRRLAEPPFYFMSLPYHPSNQDLLEDLQPGEIVELVFDLYPTSKIFKKGQRIRLTIACADKDNALALEKFPPDQVAIYRNSRFCSYILLPVIPTALPTATDN